MMNKGIPRWGLMIAAMSLMTVFAQTTWSAGDDETVGQITSAPTNIFRPGKVVWVDLVTSDISKAADFYRDVFGWDINISRDGSFAQASYQGSPVSSIALFNENEAPEGEARWLVSISVSDVDGAAKAVRTNGGKVLDGPADLPDRGRYVLVEDSRGALLMLLKASGGDPEDETAVDNAWLWAELWTDDPAKAVGFYHSVIGYKSVSVKDSTGDEILVLGRDQKARATVVKLPWEEVESNWLPYMRVASVLETTKSVLEHGGEVVIAPMIDDDGSRVAVVADNTGGVFAIKQGGSE
jgi:predicted enzyme related to lactoylglutathione lyase